MQVRFEMWEARKNPFRKLRAGMSTGACVIDVDTTYAGETLRDVGTKPSPDRFAVVTQSLRQQT